MQIDNKQRQAVLKAFIDDNGLKVSVWEREAGLGEGTVRNYFKREGGAMSERTYEALARAASKLLERPVRKTELQGTQPDGDTSLGNVLASGQPSPRIGVAASLPSLIVYRSAPSGALGGNTLIFQQKIGEVERLKKYEFAQKAFCIEATDDLMSPYARARDTLIVDPDKIPRKNDECLFVRDPDAEPCVTLLRHLVDIKANSWLVCEHNGRKTPYELTFADYPAAWPVVAVIKP